MDKPKKRRRKKEGSPKFIRTEKKPAMQIFKKNIFYNIMVGTMIGVIIGVIIGAILLITILRYFGIFLPKSDYLFYVCFLGTIGIISFLFCWWLISRPNFLISKKEIVVFRKGKQDIHYIINHSFHIKITMIVFTNGPKVTSPGLNCLLFLTFVNKKFNLKQKYISGWYGLEATRDFIFALEDYDIQYYLKGFNAKYLARLDPTDFKLEFVTNRYRKITESTLKSVDFGNQ